MNVITSYSIHYTKLYEVNIAFFHRVLSNFIFPKSKEMGQVTFLRLINNDLSIALMAFIL